jgi:hypothetical protein
MNENWVVAAVALIGTITLLSPEVTDYSIRPQLAAGLNSGFYILGELQASKGY